MRKSYKRRTYKSRPQRIIRDRFYISVEGRKTEDDYFEIVRDLIGELGGNGKRVSIRILSSRKNRSAPKQVLKRMERELEKTKLQAGDEAWLVVDKNRWPESELLKLNDWSKASSNFNLALSNPNFEFWLLLHFENGTGIGSKDDCRKRLKKYIKEYDKEVPKSRINLKNMLLAVDRAKTGGSKSTHYVLGNVGSTTVYKLVENLLKKQNS